MHNTPTRSVTYIEIDEDRAGQRIDNFLLSCLKGVPKKHIYRILRRGEVRVNSKRIRPFYRLAEGDSIRIPPVHLATVKTPQLTETTGTDQLKNRIIYEDEWMLAINKPAGIPVHGGSGQQCGLIEALRLLKPEAHYLELVHRLDLETSGCVLIAKKRSVLRILHDYFRNNQVNKCYQALLAGRWQKNKVLVSAPIRKQRTENGARKVFVANDGKEAVTEIRRLQQWGQYTLVECRPRTGRTHQIRVHAQHIGHPIVCDQRYGNTKVNQRASKNGLNRQFLHASSLHFKHPRTGEIVALHCPLDNNLALFLSKLGFEE